MYVNLKHKYVIFWQQLLKLQKQVFNARKHRRYILQVWETRKNSFMWRDTVLVYGYIYMCVILVSKKEDFFILSSRLEFTILLILSIYTKPLPLLTPAVCRVVNLRVCGLISHGHSELLSYCLVLMTKQEKNILGISIDTIKFSWNTIAMVLMGCLSLFFWFILSSMIHLISWILCSWNIGPAHIISYSTEVYFWLQYGIEQIVQQYNWLIRDLEVKKYSLHYPCICFFVAFSCLSTSSVVPFFPSFSPFFFIHSLLPLPSTSPKLFFFCVIICSFKGWVIFSVCPRFFSIQL